MAKLEPNIAVITLFEDDLDEAKAFYQRVFGLRLLFDDQDSAGFTFGGTVLNLLKRPAARELIAPAHVANRQAGARSQFTIFVEDVDGRCEHLRKAGVQILNGPMNRPWCMRTATFMDPSGHIWELAKDLS